MCCVAASLHHHAAEVDVSMPLSQLSGKASWHALDNRRGQIQLQRYDVVAAQGSPTYLGDDWTKANILNSPTTVYRTRTQTTKWKEASTPVIAQSRGLAVVQPPAEDNGDGSAHSSLLKA